MARGAGGRPSELTPERREKILNAIKVGCTREAAAMLGGVGVTTLYRWLQKGRTARAGDYREFWQAVQEAEAQAELVLIARVRQASATHWKAAAWILERRHPRRWGRRDRMTLAGDRHAPLAAEFTLAVPKPPKTEAPPAAPAPEPAP